MMGGWVGGLVGLLVRFDVTRLHRLLTWPPASRRATNLRSKYMMYNRFVQH